MNKNTREIIRDIKRKIKEKEHKQTDMPSWRKEKIYHNQKLILNMKRGIIKIV